MTNHQHNASKFASSLTVSRRHFMMGAAGLAAVAGFGIRPAAAARDVAFLGWEGYDLAFKSTDLLGKAGVNMQPTYISAIEDIITKLRGGGIGSIDLTTLIYQYVSFCGQSDLLGAIDESLVPNLAAMHPRVKALDKFLRVDDKLYGVPFTFSAIPLLYNPDLVEEPKSWLDLLKPEYKGHIAFPAITNGYGVDFLVMLAKAFGGSEDNIDPGFEAMKKIKGETIFKAASDLPTLFGQGDIWIMPYDTGNTFKLQQAGLPVAFATPQEGSPAVNITACVAKGAKNADVAGAAIDMMLKPEAQIEIARRMRWTASNPETKLPADLAAEVPAVDKLAQLDRDKINAKRASWIERWNREIAR